MLRREVLERIPGARNQRQGPVRIAYLAPTSGSPSGLFGTERSLFETLRALDRQRFAPYLFTVMPGPLEELARGLRIEVTPVRWLYRAHWHRLRRAAASSARLAFLFRRRRIQVVDLNLFHGALDTGIISLSARLAGARFIMRNRIVAPWLSLYDKYWVSRADLIISVSRGSVRQWVAKRRSDILWRVRPERVVVIPDGRDMGALAAVPRDRAALRSMGVPDQGKVVGIVGAINPNKGQHLFLEAALMIHERRQDVWFLVIGGSYDGDHNGPTPYAEELRRLMAGRPVSERVIFTGYRRDATHLMRHFDVLVVPSEREGFPGVLIEALGLGIPTVAFDTTDIPEAVRDGVTGLLVRERNSRTFAEAILRILDDPLRANRMRSAAIQWAPEFDIHRLTRLTERYYEALVFAAEPDRSLSKKPAARQKELC